MQKAADVDQVRRLEIEIKRKEMLAADAKEKGMHTTYGNLLEDLVQLKAKLKKLMTDPLRKV
jgi:hypothetical protein